MDESQKTWVVTFPVVGTASCEVEADDEEGAIVAAWGSIGNPDNTELIWEAMEHIVQGNVFYGELNEITVDEV